MFHALRLTVLTAITIAAAAAPTAKANHWPAYATCRSGPSVGALPLAHIAVGASGVEQQLDNRIPARRAGAQASAVGYCSTADGSRGRRLSSPSLKAGPRQPLQAARDRSLPRVDADVGKHAAVAGRHPTAIHEHALDRSPARAAASTRDSPRRRRAACCRAGTAAPRRTRPSTSTRRNRTASSRLLGNVASTPSAAPPANCASVARLSPRVVAATSPAMRTERRTLAAPRSQRRCSPCRVLAITLECRRLGTTRCRSWSQPSFS